jgi:hypothetical protein
MATTHDLPWLENSWFRRAPAPEIDDFADLDAAPIHDARWIRRQRAVKALGYTCIAGLCAISAWVATSPAATFAIASWGTMGQLVHPRLTPTSLEGDDPAPHEFALETSMMAWPEGPAPAEPSRPAAADTEAPAPEAALAQPPVAHPGRTRRGADLLDDPYAGVTVLAAAPPTTDGVEAQAPREQDTTPDPYSE